jgi:hypothetical protein
LVLFQSFGNKLKSSAFVLTIFGTHQNVLVSLRFSAPISERLCFRFGIVDITTYDWGGWQEHQPEGHA